MISQVRSRVSVPELPSAMRFGRCQRWRSGWRCTGAKVGQCRRSLKIAEAICYLHIIITLCARESVLEQSSKCLKMGHSGSKVRTDLSSSGKSRVIINSIFIPDILYIPLKAAAWSGVKPCLFWASGLADFSKAPLTSPKLPKKHPSLTLDQTLSD